MSRSARNLLAITAATGAVLSLMAAASSPTPGRPRAPVRHCRGCGSLYVPMPDGVRLAVDVWLPAAPPPATGTPTSCLSSRPVLAARGLDIGGIKDNPIYQIALPWNRRGDASVSPTCAARARPGRHAHRRTRRGRTDRRARGLARGTGSPRSRGRTGGSASPACRTRATPRCSRWPCATRTSPPPRRSPTTSIPTRTRPPWRDPDSAADRPLRAAAADPRQAPAARPAPPVPRPSRSARRPG